MPIYIIAILIVAAVALIGYSLFPKQKDAEDAIKRRMTGRTAQAAVANLRQQAKESVAKRVIQSVAPIAILVLW